MAQPTGKSAVDRFVNSKFEDLEPDPSDPAPEQVTSAAGLPKGSTWREAMHANMDDLFEAIVEEIREKGTTTVASGIRVDDSNGNQIGETAETGSGEID